MAEAERLVQGPAEQAFYAADAPEERPLLFLDFREVQSAFSPTPASTTAQQEAKLNLALSWTGFSSSYLVFIQLNSCCCPFFFVFCDFLQIIGIWQHFLDNL